MNDNPNLKDEDSGEIDYLNEFSITPKNPNCLFMKYCLTKNKLNKIIY